jgi:hypothetical protein
MTYGCGNLAGESTILLGRSNCAFGPYAGQQGIGVGFGNCTQREGNLFGHNNFECGSFSTLIGTANQANCYEKCFAVAVGNNNTTSSEKTIQMGGNNLFGPGATGAIAIGQNNVGGTDTPDLIIIGNNNVGPTGGQNNIIAGCNNSPVNVIYDSVLIGQDSNVVTSNGCADEFRDVVIIGRNNLLCGFGDGTGANTGRNVIIGNDNIACGNASMKSVVIGCGNLSGRGVSVVIGNNSVASNQLTVAIGHSATAGGETSVAIGYQVANNNYGVTIGYGGSGTGLGSVSIGMFNQANTNGTVALGYYSCATCVGSVAIGQCAVSSNAAAYVFAECKTSEKDNTLHANHIIAYGQGASKYHAVGNITGTTTLNWDNGNNQSVTLTGSVILGFSNPIAGANYNLVTTQGGTGSYTITWAGVKWLGGTPPTLSTLVGDTDIISLMYDGTSYYGSYTYAYA